MWVACRRGDGKHAQAYRARLTAAQLERLDALPYCEVVFSAEDALSALEVEVARQREQDPNWRMPQSHVMATAWDRTWKAGMWVSSRRGDGKNAQAYRARLTATQLERLDALPYGEVVLPAEDALAALEAEVARQQEQNPTWRMPTSHVMATAWDSAWKAGMWVAYRRGDGKNAQACRARLTAAQLERLYALPYGTLSAEDALAALELEVARQRQQDPTWRMSNSHVMVTAWDPAWQAGRWMQSRRGDGKQAQARRARLTAARLERLDALPYGRM